MRSRSLVWLILLILAAGAARGLLATRPGLWADEVFSLAMATGHSLEQPGGAANPALGDYVETPEARPPARWAGYARQETPPAGPGHVIRAVLLSDTNPPAYYLLLNAWTRLAGTSDAALRLFSVLCSLACFPLLWCSGRATGGRRTAWTACLLFACAPAALFYSAEGRMYALTWLLGLGLAWATLLLRSRGPRPAPLLAWIATAATGLLTHYFFVFVALACGLWLLRYPGAMRRRQALAAALAAGALVAPWFLHLPESLSRWRVTADWLGAAPLLPGEVVLQAARLASRPLSGRDIWGGSMAASAVVPLLLCGAFAWVLWRGRARPLFRPQAMLLWGWCAASVIGVVAFDLLRGTGAARIGRYALPGLPAGILLAALLVGRLPRRAGWVVLALLLVAWFPGLRDMYTGPARRQSLDGIARMIERRPLPDLVIVQSIPSGVIGVSRYLRSDLPVASWVPPLEQRHLPGSMLELLAGRCRIAVVRLLMTAGPLRADAWLGEHAALEERIPLGDRAEILRFRLGTRATELGWTCPPA